MQTLDEFLAVTQERIPTVGEMVGLCEALGIRFLLKDGQPVLRATGDTKPEAKVLAALFRREPFRSQVLEATQPREAFRSLFED